MLQINLLKYITPPLSSPPFMGCLPLEVLKQDGGFINYSLKNLNLLSNFET